MRPQFLSADAAAALIPDVATVALMGGGGGLLEATGVFQAVERRFLATQHPRGLTAVHALGIGDKATRGMNCFAHEGLVRRGIGGRWAWSPRMQQLGRDNQIEAYMLSGGGSSQRFRAVGGGQPGLITHVGLGTVCDPRHGGGCMNKAANLDARAIALAARSSGGLVIVPVKERLPRGALRAREVRIPAAWRSARAASSTSRRTRARSCSAAPSRPRARRWKPVMASCA